MTYTYSYSKQFTPLTLYRVVQRRDGVEMVMFFAAEFPAQVLDALHSDSKTNGHTTISITSVRPINVLKDSL